MRANGISTQYYGNNRSLASSVSFSSKKNVLKGIKNVVTGTAHFVTGTATGNPVYAGYGTGKVVKGLVKDIKIQKTLDNSSSSHWDDGDGSIDSYNDIYGF